MPCVVAVIALLSPRLALFVMFLFTDVLSDSFNSWLVPLLGFFLLPWATLAYALMWWVGDGGAVVGFEWLIVIVAFLADIGSYFGGLRRRTSAA